MIINRQIELLIVFGFLTIFLSSLASAQAPDRTRYSDLPDWTVTTYRAADTGAFLRCSAERHYEGNLTLTVAKNSAGKYVLGFTSSAWPYEDRSTHSVSVQIDTNEETSMPGRVRLIPPGPIVFVDLEDDRSFVVAISDGAVLQVSSGDTVLKFSLTGSAAALATLEFCHQDGSGNDAAEP